MSMSVQSTGSPRDSLFADLQGENSLGVLLVAQLGGTPNELQLILETATFDPVARGVRPNHGYSIRAQNVVEHRLYLGMFSRLTITDDHPVLIHVTAPRVAVHFDGTPDDLDSLALDLSQSYISLFQNWRHLVDQMDDFNRSMPLVDLLQRGYGLLGTMPRPLAEIVARVLAHHNVRATLSEEVEIGGGRHSAPGAKALILDEAFVIGTDFVVERMGQS